MKLTSKIRLSYPFTPLFNTLVLLLRVGICVVANACQIGYQAQLLQNLKIVLSKYAASYQNHEGLRYRDSIAFDTHELVQLFFFFCRNKHNTFRPDNGNLFLQRNI